MTREQILDLFRNSGVEFYVKTENTHTAERRGNNLMTVRCWVEDEEDQDANE